MYEYKIKLETDDDRYLLLRLFDDVKNTKTIREKLMKGQLPCCIIKPKLIYNPFQVAVAANKALLSSSRGKMTTKTLYTEVLFNISPSKNISQSLQKFGIHDDDRQLLVAFIVKDNEDVAEVLSNFEATPLPIEKISELTDVELLMKTYKIDKSELEVSPLLDSIVTRISTKDFVSIK